MSLSPMSGVRAVTAAAMWGVGAAKPPAISGAGTVRPPATSGGGAVRPPTISEAGAVTSRAMPGAEGVRPPAKSGAESFYIWIILYKNISDQYQIWSANGIMAKYIPTIYRYYIFFTFVLAQFTHIPGKIKWLQRRKEVIKPRRVHMF